MQCLQANQEPYAQGPWRREPWPVRPYESIAAYQVAPDAGEAADHAALLAKLRTSKACGPGCPSTVSFPLDLASAVNGVVVDAVPQALQLGLDVVERPAWGMDCFTHRAIFDALGQCSELVPADALAEESVRIRHDFIEHTLLPAINRQAEAGWDICRAIQEVRSTAQRDGSSARAATAEHLLTLVNAAEQQHRLADAQKLQKAASAPKGSAASRKSSGGLARGKQTSAPLPTDAFTSNNGASGAAVSMSADLRPLDGSDAISVVQCAAAAVTASSGAPPAVPATHSSALLADGAHAGQPVASQHQHAQHATPSSGGMESVANGCAEAPHPVSMASSNMDAQERFYFRLHPKGQGVMCKREGGLPAGTFVAEYLGELYSPWRWFEKQDALKKRNPHMGLPDFYNITLERPKDDEAGYDVVFVEAAQKASFASRLSHSCTPNCHTMSLAVDGRLTIGIFTSRDVAVGEELSWDYACVTESEREYRSAICMCGTRSCRGSFLYYANSSSFQAVMSKRHNFLDRNALVVRASCEEPTEADWERLKAHGIGRSILGANPDAQISEGWPPLPWMVKWASFILEFVELERAELPGALVEKAELGYTLEGAAVEADGVRDNRVQNLAITVDKAKFFMRHQTAQMQVAPLHVLTDAEVVEFLWSGAQSIGRRSAMLALQHISPAPAASGKQRKPANADAPNGLAAKGAAEIQALLKSARPADAAAARQLLCTLRSTLLQQGPAHAAMCDLLALYAHTQLFFSPSKFKPLTSAEVHLGSGDASQSGSGDAVQAGSVLQESMGNGTKATKGKGAAKKAPKAKAEAAGKPYRPAYLWGQLTAWFKQTVYDPTASLSADRRGTVSLPDPESAYCPATTSGKYLTGGERKALLDMLTRTPFVMWPTSTLWSFKNAAKVYGSPMLDAALRCSRAGTTLSAGDATWDALLTELRSAS